MIEELPDMATGIIQEGQHQGFEAIKQASAPEAVPPDEGRLLTEEIKQELGELCLNYLKLCKYRDDYSPSIIVYELMPQIFEKIETQDAKTASIKEAECQARVMEIADDLVGRGEVGMDALPEDAQGFWKGYWQALIDKGQSLKKELK